MTELPLHRAHTIVDRALVRLARAEHVVDAFEPFQDGGAQSRDEAQDAVKLVMAGCLRRARLGATPGDSLLDRQMRASRGVGLLAARIASGNEPDPERAQRLRAHAYAAFDEFYARLETLDPADGHHYWPAVYRSLELAEAITEMREAPPAADPAAVHAPDGFGRTAP